MKNRFAKSIHLFAVIASLFFSTQGYTHELPIYYPKQESIAEYLGKMPWHLYKSYYVPGLGTWFWVDEAKDCVKDTIKQGKIWEPYIINVLKKYVKEGDKVIDVGAHMGTISLALSNLVGENGQVYAFEAEPQFFRELYFNIHSNGRAKNMMPYLCWLGDKNEDVKCLNQDVFITSKHPYSPVCNETIGSWIRPHRTLDSFKFTNIALMKIDIECTEDELLEGAKKTIADSRPVLVIEIMGGFGWSESPEVKARIRHTISILESMDYMVSKIWVDDYLAIPKEKEYAFQ
ncbi:MAG: FkbM family methyltransferase [Candidatus Rhabdochlamydia sp.]